MKKKRGACSSVAKVAVLMVSFAMAVVMFAAGTGVATVTLDAEQQQVSEGASFWIYTMAVDSRDRPHILYHDSSNIYHSVKEGGTWRSSMVDSIWERFDLALGPDDGLNLCYLRYNYMDDDVELVYSTNTGGTWRSEVLATGWDIISPQIAVDGHGNAHICHHTASGDLVYRTNSGGSWTDSTLVDEVDTTNGQIFVRGEDVVGIVYSDDTNGLLKSATKDGGSWSTQAIDEGASSYSLALTPGDHDNVHLCYMVSGNMFKYATTKGGQWYSEVIPGSGMASNYQIAAGPDDKAHVVYVDDVDGDLKYTTNAEGTWSTHLIDQSGDVGNCQIAVGSSGDVHIGFNYPYGDLMYATNSDGAWTTHVVEHTEIGVLSSGPLIIGPKGMVHIAYQRSMTNEIFYGSFTPSVITRPGLPENVTVTPQQGYANISWSPPATNGSADIVAYKLYRGPNLTSMMTLAIVEGTSFMDAGTIEGTTYYYQVSAVNREGEGERSSIVNITLMNTPSAPTNLTLSNEDDHILLHWEPPTDDGGSPVTGYKIFRGVNDSALDLLTTVDNTSFEDFQVLEGVTYYYAVVATNDLGAGSTSEAVNGAIIVNAPSQTEGLLPLAGMAIAGVVAVTGVLLWRRGRSKG